MPYTLNCSAIKTLNELERTLRRQIDQLMAIDCQDAEAAEEIIHAVESLNASREHAIATRRSLMKKEDC